MAQRIRKIKYAPPPPELPIYGKVNPEECSFFGRTNYEAALEEKKFIFGIKRADRRRHLYLVGKSGVGKSKLMELIIRQDIAYGHGVCLIDPHGDFIEDILAFIPKERVNDVIVIDPSDTDFPVSFNPLSNIDPTLKHQVTQGLLEVLEKQFGANWTPRLEHVFRFTTLALLDYPEATMRGMISMLTDRNYRQKVVDYIEDDMVKRFWAVEFADWSEKFDTEAIIPLVNKLSQFLSNPLMRNIFGQKENKVDLEKIMNEKKILLISLSKGKLGEESSSFFGSMFITKIYQAGMARASMPEADRKDFYLYVDEFQNLVTDTFENLFTESRKYGLCITVAHQYIAQLLTQVLATVLGNIGTIVIFRIGGDDAVKMAVEMTPVFSAEDMINLGIKEFYIKMTIDGETFDPFSAETLNVLPPTHNSLKEEIIKQSREKYAVPLEEVKKKLEEEEMIKKTGKVEIKKEEDSDPEPLV
ncbi:type IV secretion system DNA-binding domain-containing protein [Patescibacteria group bacterium]|nr:type IV secretion system DNA-binding domain-containing protein [Patescibacteria group bacterium]MBU1563719.1 type IV secretion system DNA-binding domain-containing protein [Patescibacteria group bacterium]